MGLDRNRGFTPEKVVTIQDLRRMGQRTDGESPDGKAAPVREVYGQNKRLHEVLKDREWEGQRAFLIGGGPSLKGFDFKRLRGERVIAINRAVEVCGFADVMVAMDARLHEWYVTGALGQTPRFKFENYKGLRVWLETGRDLPLDVVLARNLGEEAWGGSLEEGLGNGNNSGYMALNLAVLLGANPIYLLGFDMRPGADGGQEWFHTGYPQRQKGTVYRKFQERMDRGSRFIPDGVQVVNLNPESGLETFPKADPEKDVEWAEREYNLLVRAHYGLGDNVYEQAFVRAIAEEYSTVYVQTPFPQLYHGIENVAFVPPKPHQFRTQMEAQREWTDWVKEPVFQETLRMDYYLGNTRQERGVVANFKRFCPVERLDFDLPLDMNWMVQAEEVLEHARAELGVDQKMALVKYPTVRREWAAPARAPRVEYLDQCVRELKEAGYYVVSIASLEDNHEWWTERGPVDADLELHHNEGGLWAALGLAWLADRIVTCPSFLVPVGLGFHKPVFGVFGGSVKPEVLVDGEVKDAGFWGYAAPEPFCACWRTDHQCYKDIPQGVLDGNFSAWMDGIPLAPDLVFIVPPGIGDISWVMTQLATVDGRRVEVQVCGNKPRRGLDFVRLLPFVHGAEYLEEFQWPIPPQVPRVGAMDDIQSLPAGRYVLEANSWLEAGNRLSEFGRGDMEFHYPIHVPEEVEEAVETEYNGLEGPVLGLYCSKYNASSSGWNLYRPEEWSELATRVLEETGGTVVFLGASYDEEIGGAAHGILEREDGPVRSVNLIGRTSAAELVAWLKRLDLLVAYPSGIGVLGDVVRTPTLMFIPPSLANLVGAYQDPMDDYHVNMIYPPLEEAMDMAALMMERVLEGKEVGV